jgi:hypothetical protein
MAHTFLRFMERFSTTINCTRIARSTMAKESEIKMFVFTQMNAQQGLITTKINEGLAEFRNKTWKELATMIATKLTSAGLGYIPAAGGAASTLFDMATEQDPPGATVAEALKAALVIDMFVEGVNETIKKSPHLSGDAWKSAATQLAQARAARKAFDARLAKAKAELDTLEKQAKQFLNDSKYEALLDKICDASAESIEMTSLGKPGMNRQPSFPGNKFPK